MKKLLVAIVAVLVSAATYAQGTVNFDNIGLGVPILDFDGTGPGTKPNSHAALFMNGAMVPGSITTFFGNADVAAQYLNAIVVALPGVTPGSAATISVGAWTGGDTFDSATISKGMSTAFSVTTGGAGEPPTLPGDLTGLTTFTLVQVPEPSTIALGLLGAGALLIRRRK